MKIFTQYAQINAADEPLLTANRERPGEKPPRVQLASISFGRRAFIFFPNGI
jgi:hypothetical protein